MIPVIPPRAFAAFDEAHGGAIRAREAGAAPTGTPGGGGSARDNGFDGSGISSPKELPGCASHSPSSYIGPHRQPKTDGAAAIAPGKVYLIGGGPGDPELLTLKAARILGTVDVVLLDHLAPQNMDALAPQAEIIPVGKVPGAHSVPQSQIQQQLLDLALSGKTVARLKGGDPFVFGRGAEELDACVAAGIECEIIPGVTSAIAVPAVAAIPVTMRKVSHMFTVVSGHNELSATDLDAVSATLLAGGTVVVLMGVRTLEHTVTGLIARGVSATLPAATIEKGYSAQQRVTITTLDRSTVDCARVRPPAVTVLGDVVRYARNSENQLLAEVAPYLA